MISILINFMQKAKDDSPKEVIEDGIFISDKDKQKFNAESLIDLTEPGIETFDKKSIH